MNTTKSSNLIISLQGFCPSNRLARILNFECYHQRRRTTLYFRSGMDDGCERKRKRRPWKLMKGSESSIKSFRYWKKLTLFFAVTLSFGRLFHTPPSSVRLLKDGKEEVEVSNCSDNKGSYVKNSNIGNTIWMPGYPGSGSELMRDLVHVLTNLTAANIHETGCVLRENIQSEWYHVGPTCKTHWPILMGGHPMGAKFKSFHSTVFLLIRNPRHAIPSYCNFDHEYSLHTASHSDQAPQEQWRSCRDASLEKRLTDWEQLVMTWQGLQRFQLVYVPYEEITNEKSGPRWLDRLRTELERARSSIATLESSKCLWERVVRSKARHRRRRTYEPAFTSQQKQMMLQVLDRLLTTNDTNLMRIAGTYHDDILRETPIEEG